MSAPAMTPSAGTDQITVTGEAVRSVLPDLAEVVVGVQTSATTPGQALRDNALRMQHLVQVAGSVGLQQADLKTLGFSIYPLYPPGTTGAAIAGLRFAGAALPGVPDLTQPPAAFRVDNSVKFALRDASRLGDLLDGVVAAGGTLVSNVAFRLSDESAVRRGLLDTAVQDARSRAEAIAIAMRRPLGDVMIAIEDTAFTQEQIQSSAELIYRARVRVTFALRPG